MYDLITWHSSALHLYICLVRPPPQAYQSKPFSPSHFPYSFILINSQVWKVHFVWNFNLKFYHRENAIIVKVNGVNFRILTELFYQNMFECSRLQHIYRPKWTVLQERHTFTAPKWVPIWGTRSPWGPFSVFGSPLGPHFCSKVPIFSI